MASGTDEYEELLADLAQPRRQLGALRREYDDLKAKLLIAEEVVEAEQNHQYGAYRQLVELERVRAFNDVARGIEHDLYNALTPVEGYTELLLENPERLADQVQAKAYLNAILNASKDAKRTVERMREFYYATGTVDFENHGSVSMMLARALASEGPLPDGASEDADPNDHVTTESLSPREWDVLKLLSDGLKNREIAETLIVSENTVKTHIKSILTKLSLKNRTQAAAYALLETQAYSA
jgi:DNA-binding CsgD family transcriptional regulator